MEHETEKDKTLKLLYKSSCNNQQVLSLARAQQTLLLDTLIGTGVEDPIAVITARRVKVESLSKKPLATKMITRQPSHSPTKLLTKATSPSPTPPRHHPYRGRLHMETTPPSYNQRFSDTGASLPRQTATLVNQVIIDLTQEMPPPVTPPIPSLPIRVTPPTMLETCSL